MNEADAALLLELTAIPTCAGREGRVIGFIDRWVRDRDDLALEADPSGNLTVRFRAESVPGPPVYFTAHLDHPAFAVERIDSHTTLELAFRGGVMDDYFPGARVEVITSDDRRLPGTITQASLSAEGPYKRWLCELDDSADGITTRDIARWLLPEPAIEDGLLHTHACDDLAAAACAMLAMDRLRRERAEGEHRADVRLLFTRAEEVGFVGALAAVRHGTIPRDAKVLALENSRAFAESPIGGGPIVRVGDRLTIFSPRLTDDVARIAEDLAGAPATPRASEKASDLPRWRWQRKLMAGGACEATVFCHAGLDATCVCLPLGNYHNMERLDEAQAGKLKDPRPAREFVSASDAKGMVDLLAACGPGLAAPPASKISQKLDELWESRQAILGEQS